MGKHKEPFSQTSHKPVIVGLVITLLIYIFGIAGLLYGLYRLAAWLLW
jgi:hypothetical protein